MPQNSNQLFGCLNINKPAGITSHDVVSHIRKLTNQNKAGHGGTLDPFATGVLLILLGSATRLMEYLLLLPKTYSTRFTLGAKSDTDDLTGNITPTKNTKPSLKEIKQALKTFIGQQQQVPPAYSAVKYKGKKLYEYARNKEGTGLPAACLPPACRADRDRQVTIYNIKLVNYNYPHIDLIIHCGSGTYIRALARDLGRSLKTNSYVSKLCRTSIDDPVEQFSITKSVQLKELTKANLNKHLLPPQTLVAHLPSITLPPSNVAQYMNGQAIEWGTTPSSNQPLATYNESGALIGISRFDPTKTLLHPDKVFI